MPERIQRRRTAGWRMPGDCRYVGRPTRWGNPFTAVKVDDHYEVHYDGESWLGKVYPDKIAATLEAVALYGRRGHRAIAGRQTFPDGMRPTAVLELGGLDLCCYCAVNAPCHADTLLEMANPMPERPWLATWGTMTALVEAATFTSALAVAHAHWQRATVRAATVAEHEALTELLAENRELSRAKSIEERRAALGFKPTWSDVSLFA